MRGRCVNIEKNVVSLLNQSGVHTCAFRGATPGCDIGDIIEVINEVIHVLTKTKMASKPSGFTSRILHPRRQRAMQVRQQVEDGIKEFFKARGFLETRTPLLVQSPGMEPHIRPYQLKTGEFVPTSPEFAMKKLLVGGLEKIFQICPAFRLEPRSPHHSPEFTILEWYRAYAGYEQIMQDFEELVEFLALKFFNRPEIQYQSQNISVKTPWPRLKVRDLFFQKVGIDLVKEDTKEKLSSTIEKLNLGIDVDIKDTWDDLYFKIWLNLIEGQLPKDRGVIVSHYPVSQSSLSVIEKDVDGTSWAKRFEPYAGGLELGNAFEELTDSVEQLKRFREDMQLREEIYGATFEKSPIDPDFILALQEGMPPSGGIAVGVDRLVMLFANEPDIDFTMWLPSFISQ